MDLNAAMSAASCARCDSRAAHAAALLAETAGCEAVWRERVFCAVYEESRHSDGGRLRSSLFDAYVRM